MASGKYINFIFNSQFKRKISPWEYLFSLRSMKILFLMYIVTNITDGKFMMFLVGVLLYFLIKGYLETRMNFATKLKTTNKVDASIAIPAYSFITQTREKYLRKVPSFYFARYSDNEQSKKDTHPINQKKGE